MARGKNTNEKSVTIKITKAQMDEVATPPFQTFNLYCPEWKCEYHVKRKNVKHEVYELIKEIMASDYFDAE